MAHSIESDVVIVGGGLVGSTLAAAIATHPLSHGLCVTLIDPSPPSAQHLLHPPPPSLRTSTISPSSHAFLDHIGIWSHVPSARAVPFADMLVWDNPAPLSHANPPAPGVSAAGTLHFSATDVDAPAMGHVVDNDALRVAAFRRLAELSSPPSTTTDGTQNQHSVELTVLEDSVQTIEFDPDKQQKHQHGHHHHQNEAVFEEVPWPVVQLSSGATVRARLLIAADGARSRVRTMAGVDWYTKRYDQSAVVANVTVDAQFHTALQRFLPTGPLAMLPMCNLPLDGSVDGATAPGANIIWTTTPAEAGALLRADDAAFIDELNAALCGYEDEHIGGYKTTSDSTHMSNTNTTNNDSDNNKQSNNFETDSSNNDSYNRRDAKNEPFLWSAIAQTVHGATVAADRMLSRSNNSGAAFSGMAGTWGSPTEPLPSVPQARRVVGKRGSFPLSIGHAPQYVHARRRLALVGDAAHAVHPLAGQGVNLGFADAQRLADCIGAAAGGGRDLGGEDGAPLRNYEAERVVGNVAVLGALHGVQQTFAAEGPGFRGLRRTGMSVLNAMPMAKRLLVRAMR